MSTPSLQSGHDGETALTAEDTARTGGTAAQRFGNRVGVVIADESIPEDALRRWLGDSLPLRITSWQHRAYHEVIRRLRPRVVVVVAATQDLAWDSGNLIACLFGRFEPTVVSAAAPVAPAAPADRAGSSASERGGDAAPLPRLLIHRLGFRAQTELASLAELTLLE